MLPDSYWDHVTDAASVSAFERHEDQPHLLSAESLPENSSVIDFRGFIQEEPERLFQLLTRLRPEWQEIFIEYFLLEKSQSFIASVHGFIQTRCWQALRMTEQAIGALIVLGTEPSAAMLRPTLEKIGLEKTSFGSLASMIELYTHTRSYPQVAENVKAPIPAIRKIFRPAIKTLLTSKDLKATAIGAFLRNLTHQASLTGEGLSKRYCARIKRLKKIRFDAPPPNDSPLICFGDTSELKDTPWVMFEISSDFRMSKIFPLIQTYGKRIFGKKAAQIFAPVDANGELELGYILARSVNPTLAKALIRIRGISEIAARCNGNGEVIDIITVPDSEVQPMIKKRAVQKTESVKLGDFVKILTGDAAQYHGVVIKTSKVGAKVRVTFPSGRCFTVAAEPGALKTLTVPVEKRCFWGARL